MDSEIHVLTDLYNTLEIDPSNIDAHERLLTAWLALDDDDMALGVATNLLQLDPGNECAKRFLRTKSSETRSNEPRSRTETPQTILRPATEKELEDGYASLKVEASMLFEELNAISTSKSEEVEMLENLKLIASGRVSSAVPMAEPLPVREAAREISANLSRAQELLVEDFETVTHWMKMQNPAPDADAIRSRLVKRKILMEAALPATLSAGVSAAFATAERELLEKKYVNASTMITEEPLSSIPRENFLVTEDNYAWDMEELVQAISSNVGVMRNPLSKQLFSESDIQAILAHRLGQPLRPMQEAQHRMRSGFRPATIDWIVRLGDIMVRDQSEDAGPSRNAIDEFLAYVATLPHVERQAIGSLKIPARDRHTGQPYDYTVGESVRDAKANTTCFHKVGAVPETRTGNRILTFLRLETSCPKPVHTFRGSDITPMTQVACAMDGRTVLLREVGRVMAVLQYPLALLVRVGWMLHTKAS